MVLAPCIFCIYICIYRERERERGAVKLLATKHILSNFSRPIEWKPNQAPATSSTAADCVKDRYSS